VRQGCNLSPLFFNIYIEKAINESKEYCTGVKVNGIIKMLSFADDIAITAQDEMKLKKSAKELKRYFKK
jgi:hypothetical protein